MQRPALPQISPPGGPDLVVAEDGGGRRGKGGSELQNAATAWLQSQNLAQEARRTQARANAFADGAYVAQGAMMEAEQSYDSAVQDASESAQRQSGGDGGSGPTSNVAAHDAAEAAKASAGEALQLAQGHRKQLGFLVKSANAADEAAAELDRASERASADFQQLAAKLKTSIPGQWQRRLDDEIERQSKETYKSQVGRGLLMADSAQQRLVGRVEARGDKEVRSAGSSLAAQVEARTGTLQRELDVHAMRSSSLSGLDAEQARLSAKVADGTASAIDRRMERKLREGKSQRDRERAENIARDISNVTALIDTLGALIKKKSDSGDDAAAASLQVKLNELRRLLKTLTAQKEELERRLAAEKAEAAIDYLQLFYLLNPPFVVRLDIEPIVALAEGLQLRSAPQSVSKVRLESPEGGLEAGGLVVNLSPDHAGFGTTSIIPSQGFDSNSADSPIGPPQITDQSGLPCAQPPCCPPGTCDVGQVCECKPKVAPSPTPSGGPGPTPDTNGSSPADPTPEDEDHDDTPATGGGTGAVGRGLAATGEGDEMRPEGTRPGLWPDGMPEASSPSPLTVSEASIQTDPPATSLAGQGKSAVDRPDIDESEPSYRQPGYRQADDPNRVGLYGMQAIAEENAAKAKRAAELAGDHLKWAEARRVELRTKLSEISGWVFELRERARREETNRYDSTIEYLIGRSDELKVEFEYVKAAIPKARSNISRHLDAFEHWSEEAGVRAPRIERERLYAKYSAIEILGRGLVDTVTGMTGLDALIPPMLPDGSGQAGGFLAGLLLAPLVGGLKAAAQIGSVTVDTVKAIVRVKRAADAVELAQKGRGGLRLVEATVELKKATEAMKVIEKGAKVGATAGQAVRAAEAAKARRATELGGAVGTARKASAIEEASTPGTRRATQFFRPRPGGLGDGGTSLLRARPETGRIGRMFEGHWEHDITWVAPRSIKEHNWFSRMMTGVGLRRNVVEFDVLLGEMRSPRGLKVIVGRYQKAIPGEISLVGRNPVFKVLPPNYAEYAVRVGLGAGISYATYATYRGIRSLVDSGRRRGRSGR
ncbi:MAG: hypothetical protein U1E39_00745 [Planctomycetota bacterium]